MISEIFEKVIVRTSVLEQRFCVMIVRTSVLEQRFCVMIVTNTFSAAYQLKVDDQNTSPFPKLDIPKALFI